MFISADAVRITIDHDTTIVVLVVGAVILSPDPVVAPSPVALGTDAIGFSRSAASHIAGFRCYGCSMRRVRPTMQSVLTLAVAAVACSSCCIRPILPTHRNGRRAP